MGHFGNGTILGLVARRCAAVTNGKAKNL